MHARERERRANAPARAEVRERTALHARRFRGGSERRAGRRDRSPCGAAASSPRCGSSASPASGKSHLLQGACHAAVTCGSSGGVSAGSTDGRRCRRARWARRVRSRRNRRCRSLVGQRPWEEALLHLYQQLLGRGATLLLASRVGPLELDFRLADLASRLRAAQVFAHSSARRFAIVRNAIERLAAQRGLELGADVMSFILRRAPRRMDELIATFERLDRGALAQQRRLTIPLAKDVLGL